MRTKNRNILLFMDNCGAHPHLDLSHVELAFLPPNTTSKLQLMNARIIQVTKMTYRKKFRRHVLFLMDVANSASDIAKQVTILDAILWMRAVWDAVSAEAMSKCFARCGFGNEGTPDDDTDDGSWDPEDLQPLLPAGVTLRDYATSDDALETQKSNDSDDWEKDLLQYDRSPTDATNVPNEEEDQKISVSAAWNHTDDLRKFALQTADPRLFDLITTTSRTY